ncbi:MAG TPA: DNRLRE domain-containing protein [Lacipirellula sp.]
MKRTHILLTAAMAGLLAGAAASSSAATLTLPAHADTYLRDATARGALDFIDVRGGNVDFRGYLRFDLSAIPAGATIDAATLVLTKVSGASRNDTITNGRFALYGLNNDAGNTPQNWDEATFVPDQKGTEDVTTLTGVTDLDDGGAGISETLNGGATEVTVTGAPLSGFLQSRFADGGLATFILSNDDGTDRGFGFGSKENADPLTHPALTIEYTPIPEPATVLLLAMCGGVMVVHGRRR